MEKYDIILIGTGAGGGTVAHQLASSGKKILILERGDFLPRERENWDMYEVTKGRYRTQEKWYDADNQPFAPYMHYWVGGQTKVYGGALLRLRESDFKEVKHYGGISPAWELSYQDFEPYYTQAEKLYSVHGERGADPCEPPSQEPYPFPALVQEPKMQEMHEALQKLGYQSFTMPVGVRMSEDKKISGSKNILSMFDGFPDLTEAKADSHIVGINYALQFPNVTLITNALVEKLKTDARGRKITEVVVNRNGEQLSFQGDTIIVSCGAINSAALLLRSANDQHPKGLGNSSGLLGRNLMIHNNGVFLAITDTHNSSVFQKSFGLTDFYHRAPDSELPLGIIQTMGKADPDAVLGSAQDLFPNESFESLSARTMDFFLTAEDLPLYENQVVLRKDGSIQTIYTQNNLEAYQRLWKKWETILTEIAEKTEVIKNPKFVGFKLGSGGVSHQNGTMKFGSNPQNSVLDLNCKAHDLDNLYVVDGSFFVSSGAVNPSLTIMANALRVSEHLLKIV
jgi:choline dehydrogenase-like flavoprotein